MSHMSHCQIAWTCPNNRANWAKYTSRKAKIGITGKAPKYITYRKYILRDFGNGVPYFCPVLKKAKM